MDQNNEKGYYDEIEAPVAAKVGVIDAGKFILTMLRFFNGKGTLYISSYDFGYWAGQLSIFRSPDKVKLNTSLPDPAFLENGFSITDEFIYVFSIDCLKNIDVKNTFNQLLIYESGRPLLQCCGNFDDVYLNADIPQDIIDKLFEEKSISSWEV